MLLSCRDLQAGPATICPLASLADIRRELRRVRRAKDWTLDKVRDESGVDRAAIHKIENVDKYPTYEPGIETVTKIVEGMGLTLSSFFARIEGLPTTDGASTDRPSPTKAADHARVVSDRSADALVQQEFLAALAEQFISAVDRLVDARAKNRPDHTAKSVRRRRAGSSR